MKYLRFIASVLVLTAAIYFIEDKANTSESDSSSNLQHSNSSNAITDYSEARSILWQQLYTRGGNTLYCGESFNSQQRNGFNVEHVFPMSWVTNSVDCGTRNQCRSNSAIFNKIEADLHNLYPARTDINQARSSFAFGEIQGEQREFGKDCDFEVSEQRRVAEPAPSVRGDVARAMFYMAFQYRQQGLILFNKQQQLLHQWHQNDPPNAQERERNNRIEKLQGNRNPFIDSPEQLDKLIADGYFS
ncbi:MAG: endonuclease [Acidiferrobacterales bacterium]|nr:endonuclease [Acidiferrobacterales bacterium]